MRFELMEGGVSRGHFTTQDQAESRAEQLADDRGHTLKAWDRVFNTSSHAICEDDDGAPVSVFTVRAVSEGKGARE